MAAPPSVPAPTSTSSSAAAASAAAASAAAASAAAASAAAASAASASASGSSAAPAVATTGSSKWSSEQDRLFEKALATYNQDSPTRWDDVSAMVPGKTPAEVKKHYEVLVQDIRNIEAGLIALPSYGGRDALLKEQNGSVAVESPVGKKVLPSSCSSLYPGHANGGAAGAVSVGNGSNTGGSSKSSKSQDQERRKGIPWTEDEHRLFLLGLEKFGKGDWRSISRNFVVSRTPTQVASHAQKYFIRLNSIHKDKRRTSIHDITSVNGDGRQQSQAPITGQGGGGAAVGQPASGTGVYGSSVGQPIAAAVGTPVPLTGQPVHGPYGPRTHMSRPVVPGTPLNVPHMAYPMPQPAMHH